MDIKIKIERDIKKAKNKLIAKAKKTGIYENFGQKEVVELRNKYKYYDCMHRNFPNLIDLFDKWCMNFDDNDLKLM